MSLMVNVDVVDFMLFGTLQIFFTFIFLYRFYCKKRIKELSTSTMFPLKENQADNLNPLFSGITTNGLRVPLLALVDRSVEQWYADELMMIRLCKTVTATQAQNPLNENKLVTWSLALPSKYFGNLKLLALNWILKYVKLDHEAAEF